jgi:hypothetical protein
MAAIHNRIMENWQATSWEPYGPRNDDLVMLYSLHDEYGEIIVIDSLLNLDIRGNEL